MNASKTPVISIITVVYNIDREVLACLKTVFDQKISVQIEVIIVDNGPTERLRAKLAKRFPQVRYIKALRNLGFGAGNNLGATVASGQYLFFPNPDTLLWPRAIENLYQFLRKNPRAGIAAPTLFTPKGARFALQGSRRLTPLRAIAGHSVLHKLWPTNPLARDYWMVDAPTDKNIQMDVIPGTALMLPRATFRQVGGFDERFFIYFEEDDLCQQVREHSKTVWRIADSQIVHIWGADTTHLNTKKVYRESRFKYFQKYFGLPTAFLMELCLTFGKKQLTALILGLLLTLTGFFLYSSNIKN